MSSPTLRNIIIVAFIIALIPLVVLPFYNKHKELKSNISQYEEILSAIDTEGEEENTDIYGKYMASVLGTYDQREPRDEYIQSMLESVDDVVDEFDKSKLSNIPPEVRLPTLDLSKDVQLELGNGESIIVREDGRDAELVFNGKRVNRIDRKEAFSLHMYNDSKLSYPTLILGKEIYCLMDNTLVKYGTVDSLVDLEMYIDRNTNEEKLITYWKDENIEGDLITVWRINHSKKTLEREYAVIEI